MQCLQREVGSTQTSKRSFFLALTWLTHQEWKSLKIQIFYMMIQENICGLHFWKVNIDDKANRCTKSLMGQCRHFVPNPQYNQVKKLFNSSPGHPRCKGDHLVAYCQRSGLYDIPLPCYQNSRGNDMWPECSFASSIIGSGFGPL